MKNAIIIFLFFLIPAILYAQNEREDFFVAAGGSLSMYSPGSLAYGGSFTAGYGTFSALGIKLSYFFSKEDLHVLELNMFLRIYFLGTNAYSGPFLQLMAGPALLNRIDNFPIPSFSGTMSAGLCLGWRLLLKDRWFLEPAVRGGYPYIFGVGLSGGIRF
ncbi:MAG: hypothetical protein FWD14_08245 [Treponema sp.]|nr:hypothetical protein [Treponema sp.]